MREQLWTMQRAYVDQVKPGSSVSACAPDLLVVLEGPAVPALVCPPKLTLPFSCHLPTPIGMSSKVQ